MHDEEIGRIIVDTLRRKEVSIPNRGASDLGIFEDVAGAIVDALATFGFDIVRSDRSDEVERFLHGWVADHVHPTMYEPEGDHSEAASYAEQCALAAKDAGISRGTIEDHVGDLTKFMATRIEEIIDAEVADRSARDG